MLSRYMPSIVLTIWVLLLVSGVSNDIMRVPGLTALAVSLAIMAKAEAYNGRSERRQTGRRQDDDTPR